MIPRGIRNHNPLNIRRTAKDQWKGLAERQQDAAFCQFKSLEYGWRAAFYLLTRTYYHKYRLYTIRSIIRRWAPSNENNSEAYIANVSKLTGIAPDEPLGIPSEQPARWMMLGMAMAIQENGTSSLDYFAMLRGWEMAAVHSISPPEFLLPKGRKNLGGELVTCVDGVMSCRDIKIRKMQLKAMNF